MASSRIARTLSAYTIQGHIGADTLDYRAFFEAVFSADLSAQRFQVFGEMVTITFKVPDRGAGAGTSGALRFVAGSADEPALFYDEATGEERAVNADGGVFVRGTWTYVDADARVFVIESKRPGISSAAISRYFEELGSRVGFAGVRFDLTISAGADFVDEVERLVEVKRASISLAQPNLDWGDTEADVHDYAEKSGAGRATIEMAAPRGESLSVGHGIIRDIKELARHPISSLLNASVTGSSTVDSAQRTVNLKRFQRKRVVGVPRGVSASQELDALIEGARDLTIETKAAIDADNEREVPGEPSDVPITSARASEADLD